MFVVIIEKRISAEVKTGDKDSVDWYVLLASALPFAPVVGTEIQIPGAGATSFVRLERVVYNPGDGTFWAQAKTILHPKPDAETVAATLVELHRWDKATEESDLVAVKKELTKSAIRKLQQTIIQAQARMASSSVRQIFDPRGPKRRH